MKLLLKSIADKLNLDELHKFSKIRKLLKMAEEIENLERLITSKIIELKIYANSFPGPDDFTGEFYQTFKGQKIPDSTKSSRK